jgi:hypothetical protein
MTMANRHIFFLRTLAPCSRAKASSASRRDTVMARTDSGIKAVGGRARARRLIAAALVGAAAALFVPATVAAQAPAEPAVTAREHAGLYSVTASFEIPQPARLTMATLTDYAAIPRYMPEVRTSQVLASGDDRAVIEQEAVARFLMFSRRVHLVLEVERERDVLRFRDRCGRSFVSYEGAWTVAERDDRTLVTYQLSAKPSFDVPAFLLTRLLKRDASQMIERLKAEIDTRARRSGQ